jgi:tRNA A37 threonylcarbamoyladenosine dehydratase
MKKYKQKLIPITSLFDAKGNELAALMRDFYKKELQGKTIINKHIGVTIVFTSEGIGKLTQKRRIGNINASAIKVIHEMLENAEYSNFGQRKPEDKQNVIGYLNFKAKAKIGGVLRHFRISVKLKTDMKAYYNHTVNRYSEDKV